jgi:signal transduction histidine kinase
MKRAHGDGLKENNAYFGLIFLISRFINELEVRRITYREKAKKGGRNRTIDEEINSLFDFVDVGMKINRELDQLGMSRLERETVGKVVNEALESEKQKKSAVAIKIKDTIAIYQGQATLGKITHVVLHERRKDIKYISETVPRIVKWTKDLSGANESELFDRLEDRSNKVISHAKGLSYLFKKIEPLARTRRLPARKYSLHSILENSFGIFSSELKDIGIEYEIRTEVPDAMVLANEMDLITIFSNLIENSVYWLRHQKRDKVDPSVQTNIHRV